MNTSETNYRSIPISERIELVEDIWDSIAQDAADAVQLSPEYRQELQRRLAAHRADPTSSVPWDAVRSALFKGSAS